MIFIGNHFILDENEKIVAFLHPPIHVFNKNILAVKNQIGQNYFENNILVRKNVLLLGDSPGDVTMVDNINGLNTLKIGFLNHYSEEKFNIYKELFDVLIMDDGTFDFAHELLTEIIKLKN